MREVMEIIENGNNHNFLLQFRNLLSSQVNCIPNSELKGILFTYYSKIGDTQAYQAINERSKRYLQKLNKGISEEGYTIREQLLHKKIV